MNVILLTILNCILLVIGQIFWKIEMSSRNIRSFSDMINSLFSFYILGGIIIYSIATLLWLYILSKAELSRVYPIQSLSYVFSLLLSIFILNENVPINRWIGVIIICIGVFFISIK